MARNKNGIRKVTRPVTSRVKAVGRGVGTTLRGTGRAIGGTGEYVSIGFMKAGKLVGRTVRGATHIVEEIVSGKRRALRRDERLGRDRRIHRR